MVQGNGARQSGQGPEKKNGSSILDPTAKAQRALPPDPRVNRLERRADPPERFPPVPTAMSSPRTRPTNTPVWPSTGYVPMKKKNPRPRALRPESGVGILRLPVTQPAHVVSSALTPRPRSTRSRVVDPITVRDDEKTRSNANHAAVGRPSSTVTVVASACSVRAR